MYSIRDRLLWTFTVVLLLAGIAAAHLTFVSARNEVDRLLDMQLKQAAYALETHPHISLQNLSVSEDDTTSLVMQLTAAPGQKPSLSQAMTPFPVLADTGFAYLRHEGVNWRIFTLHTAQNATIITAQPSDRRFALAATSAWHILQPLFLLLPFLGIAVWLVVGQGLTSLNRTARLVSQRSPSSLEPLPTEHLATEVAGLVHEINNLLSRLQESLEAQKRFASDAAHELRTPLTAIKLQAQLAQRAKTPEAQQKAFARLHEGLNRSTGLVQQLLTIARLDPDSSKKPFTKVALDQVLQSVADELTVLASQKDISIHVKASAVNVLGMEDALKLLVTNLTDNAIRYTPNNGEITLKSYCSNHSGIIEISDNGPGIAPQERERIFDRFYRALGTKTQGHGLGLAIVKRIVELHQGSIEVLDGANGIGTCMRIRFNLTP